MLKNKNILIGVTGSIAIYKSLELIRLLIKSGANVRVVMSDSAKKFIAPLTFETISQNEVLHMDSESWASDNNHIHIGKWADLFVVAPATVNTINKTAAGIADNLLLETLLAFNKKILIAPSANTNMILHQSTKNSLKRLKSWGYEIIEPQSKLLACNDEGVGAMAEPDMIYHQVARSLLVTKEWMDKEVIVTAGGTKEKIDDVRFISNHSSGKTALWLAKALYYKGAKVKLISANELKDFPKDIEYFYRPDSISMLKELEKYIPTSSHLFMAAAVSDYLPKLPKKGKLKKESIGDEFSLELIKNIDILKSIDKRGLTTIGFKAELDETTALKNARKMLFEKNLDAVCLNVIKEDNRFGGDKNEIIFITKNKEVVLSLKDKQEIAFEIVRETQNI